MLCLSDLRRADLYHTLLELCCAPPLPLLCSFLASGGARSPARSAAAPGLGPPRARADTHPPAPSPATVPRSAAPSPRLQLGPDGTLAAMRQSKRPPSPAPIL